MSKLEQTRKQLDLRLREVAEMLGITPQTVQQQEKRGVRTARIAKRYAAALGCDWVDLID